MKTQKDIIKEKLELKNYKRKQELIYKRKFDKSIMSFNKTLRCKVSIDILNKINKHCDKNNISVSKFVRELIIKELKIRKVKR